MQNTLPTSWHLSADLVAIGSGGGGLCSAITAHDHGLSACVLEASDQVGGVTAYSMGEIWVPANHLASELGLADSIEAGVAYVENLAMGYSDSTAVLNQAIHAPEAVKYFEKAIGLKLCVVRHLPDYYYPFIEGSTAEGRCLEALPFPGATLGEWQDKTRVSPHVPYSLLHEDIFGNGGMANMANWDYQVMGERLANDMRCAGPGLAAYYVKGALDRNIPLHTGVRAEALIYDGERVLGVKAVRDGEEIFIKANKGVVIATSSFERNPHFSQTQGLQINPQSMVMPTVQGTHLRLAGAVGAQIARVPDVTMLGFHVPGEEQEDGVPLWRGALPFMGLPHSLVVNQRGQRFANEAFYRSVYFALDEIDGMTQTAKNFPCWLIIDDQARSKYPLGSLMPGEPVPESMGVTAPTLESLAEKTSIDMDGLLATVDRFNQFSKTGDDLDFKRGSFPWGQLMVGDSRQQPNANMGPLNKGPYYAIALHKMAGGGITSSGLLIDHHCRVLDWQRQPITGLYAAGNSAARLDNGALMQSGITNARGMTHGYLAGRHVAGHASDLLENALKELPRHD